MTSKKNSGAGRSALRASDVARLGLTGLRARPMRAILSALGIAIGIAAMVGVVEFLGQGRVFHNAQDREGAPSKPHLGARLDDAEERGGLRAQDDARVASSGIIEPRPALHGARNDLE